jgi:hypothetical protein
MILGERIMKKILLLVLTGLFLLSASLVWAAPAPVAKTGQTISFRTGDDGDLQKGVASPDPRFTDNGDRTVTDNLTGLMWAKNPGVNGTMNWDAAIDFANNFGLGGEGCGSSLYTDWRLPNRSELESLMDLGNYPSFPSVFPFINYLLSEYYWSSTTPPPNHTVDHGWCLHLGGYWCTHLKTHTYGVWPVRSIN